MLKMYIDNEEVVSKNDFTIKEEMLSASSTILNNTYPKSWEQDKDYISRFYYPKDYSKLILNKDTYYPHIDGETIEGSSFQITADTTLEDEYYFKGNTYQEQTPTPTNPQPIQVATGNQEIEVCGKNLINNALFHNGEGVTISEYTDEYVIARFVGQYRGSHQYYNLKNGIVYTFSIGNISINGVANDTARIELRFIKDGSIVTSLNQNVKRNNSYTFTANTSLYDYIRIGVSNGSLSGTNTIKFENLQFEVGNQATTYEPYIGNKYEINLGKNLLSVPLTQYNANNLMSTIDNFQKGTYTFSFEKENISASQITVRKIVNGTATEITHKTNSKDLTFTLDENATIRLEIYKVGILLNEVSKVQLEKGSVATSFSPYFTPIELCKINDYKDRIYKENDKWYIEKNIGKVVYDGTETGWSINTSNNKAIHYRQISGKNIGIGTMFSNYFKYNVGLNWQLIANGEMTGQSNSNYIFIRYDEITDIGSFKIWLSTHNTIVYYVLETPIYYEITNEELISQLNSIELLDGLNNISITSVNLSMIMNLHYNYQTEHTDSELIFSGMVKNTNNISLNPREPKYCSLEILDYKTLLSEGKTLDYVISNKTILEAITMVVNSISEYGFELGNVNILNGNEIIGAYSTENKTAYDVLQYLADISSAKWNCRRKDNTNMYIDFYDPTLMPRGKQIEYTNEWACENNLCDIKFNYGTRDYRNKQIILSDEVEGSIEYNDRVVSDGINKEYTLPYKIASLNKIEIDGVEQSIATKEEKEVGIYADFYYSRNNDTFTSNKTLPYGTLIDVSYTPIIKGREVVQNDSEIDRLTNQLEVNGTISRYENRNDTTDSNKLINIGETYLKYKGEAEITLTIRTENNNLYNVGQIVYFNAPIPELQKDYLVKSKQIQVISSDENELNIFYTFTLSSSFNAEKEINWFDNQRAKTEGNIGEGEFISRNIDINSRANIIWDNLRVEEVDLPVGASNDLQATLESPLIH